MIGLGHQDEFLMISALVCMVTHHIRSRVNYDIDYRVTMLSPSHYVIWTLNLEKILNYYWGL